MNKRIVSLIMVLCMVLTMLPATAFANPIEPPPVTQGDPVTPPTDPVDPPADPVTPPTDPVDPPADPVVPPVTPPVDPPADPAIPPVAPPPSPPLVPPTCSCTQPCTDTPSPDCAVCAVEGADLATACSLNKPNRGRMAAPRVAAAGTEFTAGGITYKILDDITTVEVATNAAATGAVTIPATVTDAGTEYTVVAVAASAFRNCAGLTSITLPDSVTKIGTNAFNGCTALATVTIPASVTMIAFGAFNGCTKLATVTIPARVTKIDENAFKSCTSLATVVIGTGVTSIGKYAFSYTALTEVTIPASVEWIDEGAFSYTALTKVTIPAGVTSIGKYAFTSCTSLTEVTIPASVDSIGKGIFQDCTSLATVVIGTGVTSIGAEAFKGCTGLTEVKFSGTTPPYITNSTFTGCTAVAYVPNGKLAEYTTLLTKTSPATGLIDGITSIVGWEPPPATSFTIKDITLTYGDTGKKLELKGEPVGTVTYAVTAGSDVATVAAATGAITILKAGSFTVTATDSTPTTPQVVEATITVSPKTVTPTIADIPAQAYTGSAVTPTIVVTAAGAAPFVKDTDYTVAYSNNTAAGTATVTVATKAGSNYTFTPAVTKDFTIAVAVGEDGTGYATLSAAITAADKGDTIKLLSDVTEDITIGKAITLDLGGKTLTGTITAGANALTIAGTGKITTERGGMSAVIAVIGSAVTVTGNVTIIGGNAAMSTAPTLGSGVTVTKASTDVSGTPEVAYDPANLSTYKYLQFTYTAPTPPTPPTTGGGGSYTPPPVNKVIDTTTGNNSATSAVQQAVAGTTGGTVYANFDNYTSLTPEGIAAINKAAGGKQLRVQLDERKGNVVLSRITIDPVSLAAVAQSAIPVGLYYHQADDTLVTGVNNTFERYFDNTVVSIAFAHRSTMAVSAEVALKLDLSRLKGSARYFYSYNPTTNRYTAVSNPRLWVDRNGYTHITAPLGGNIIITDRQLSLRK